MIHRWTAKGFQPSLWDDDNRKKMAIVGNGPIGPDMSGWIDDCDLVLRFNEAKNYGQNSGSKADILCIGNTGIPANRISDLASILRSPFHAQVSEVWFPRDCELHKCHVRSVQPPYPESEFDDLSARLVETNELSEKRILTFSQEYNEEIYELLKGRMKRPFICPSTGFLGIQYVMTEPKFAEYEKFVLGFTFQLWDGHPWEAEQNIVLDYARTRPDFHLIQTGRVQIPMRKTLKKILRVILRKKRKRW